MALMTLDRLMAPLPDDQKLHTFCFKARYDGFRRVIEATIKVDGEEVEI